MNAGPDRLMNALVSPAYDPRGFSKDKYGPGLQHPALDPVLLASPYLMRAMEGVGAAVPKIVGNEAGAVFPEGEIPDIPTNAVAKEFEDIAPASRVNYVRNANMEKFHANNYDWPRVLQDKWAMLKHAGGN